MNLNLTFEKGHKAALIFDKESSAMVGELRDAIATVKDGKLTFIDDKHKNKVKALLKHGKIGVTEVKRGKGGRYFLDIENPEHLFVDGMVESLHENINEAKTRKIVGNIIDIRVDEPINIFGKIDSNDIDLELLPIYSSKEAIFNKSKKDIIGDIDTITGEIFFTSEEAVKKIRLVASEALDSEIGIKRMIQRDGFYLDFVSPDYLITKILPCEGSIDDEDEEEEFAHFLNDDDMSLVYNEFGEELDEIPEKDEVVRARNLKIAEQLAEAERYDQRKEFEKLVSEQKSESELKKMLSSISGKDLHSISKAFKNAQVTVGNSSLGKSNTVEVNTPEQLGLQENSMMKAYLAAALRF